MSKPPRSHASAIRDRRRTFVDDQVEESFRSLGYATLPLLGPEQTELARTIHDGLVADDPDEALIRFDIVRTDRRVIREMTEALAPLWNEVLPTTLRHHRIIFSSCVVKDPGDWSGMEPHDDRSYVDERRARSLTLWIPLVDTSVALDNGYLAILPHSEHLAHGFGGTDIATWYGPYRTQIEPRMTPLDIPAGTAVAYDSRAVHGSPPNRSSSRRAALVLVAVPEEEPLVHAVATSRRGRRLLAVDDEFHLTHSPLELRVRMPELAVVDEFEDPPVEIGPEQLAQLLTASPEALVPVADRPRQDATGEGDRSPRRRRLEHVRHELIAAAEGVCAPFLAAPHTGREAPLPVERTPLIVAGRPVGDPDGPIAAALGHLVSAGVRRAALVTLAPDASYVEPPGPQVALLPLSTPALPAGVATSTDVAPFELGLLVATDPDASNQVFNDGPDPITFVELRLG